MDDCTLIEATLAGNVEAFGTLVRKYQHILVASARHLTRNADDAEDLAQDALVDAYRNLRALKDRTQIPGLVVRHPPPQVPHLSPAAPAGERCRSTTRRDAARAGSPTRAPSWPNCSTACRCLPGNPRGALRAGIELRRDR